MTRALFWISLLLCVVVGVAHSIIGLASFEPLSPNLVWFIGSGFCILLLAALNVAAWRAPYADRVVRRLTHAANLIMSGFGFVAVRALPERQAYLALVAFLGLFIAGLLRRPTETDTGAVDPTTRV